MRSTKPGKNEWIEFNIYPELKSVNARAKAIIDKENLLRVKLLFKAPAGQYYSFLEDATNEAVRIFKKCGHATD